MDGRWTKALHEPIVKGEAHRFRVFGFTATEKLPDFQLQLVLLGPFSRRDADGAIKSLLRIGAVHAAEALFGRAAPISTQRRLHFHKCAPQTAGWSQIAVT